MKTLFGSAILLLCVVGILAAIGFQKYRGMMAPPPPMAEKPEIVVFTNPKPITIRQETTTIGTVLAPRSVQLRTELVGTVSEILFKAGQVVDENQILLKLDTSVEEAQLAGAEAAYKIAESTFQRSKQASAVRAISELELEQSAAMMAQASAEVRRLQAVIRKKTLRAPFCARAGLFDLHIGQYLPEGTQVTMLQGIDEFIHVDFMMPQQAADDVHVGDSVRLVGGKEPIEAKIVAIDSQADRITRNIMARARVDQPPATMQPNDSIRVEIEYGDTTPAVVIPASALRRAPSGAFVYVLKPDDKEPSKLRTSTQAVMPGKTVGQDISIVHGLTVDQKLVADGSFKLRDAMWVVDVNTIETPSESASAKEESKP